jgi:thymidylate kinase
MLGFNNVSGTPKPSGAESLPLPSDIERCEFPLLPSLGVEGASGAGKSTSCKLLWDEATFGAFFEEPGQYLEETDPKLPERGLETLESAHELHELWLKLDIRRQVDRASRPPNRETIKGFDLIESTPLSTMVYELAAQSQGHITDIEYLSGLYLDKFIGQALQQPSFWLFIESSPDVIHNRLMRRGNIRPLLVERDIIVGSQKMREFYRDKYLKSSEYQTIRNEEEGLTQLSIDVKNVVATLTQGNETQGLIAFCRDLLNEERVNEFLDFF